MAARQQPPRWVWIGLLIPPLVLFGTYSDSALSPLGWIVALILLVVWFGFAVRAARQRPSRA